MQNQTRLISVTAITGDDGGGGGAPLPASGSELSECGQRSDFSATGQEPEREREREYEEELPQRATTGAAAAAAEIDLE